MPNYYLAVDGGGTKTDAVCADESGAVVGRGSSGPTNLTSTSVGAASFNLIEAIRQAIETLPESPETKFPILVMGLAGIDTHPEYEEAYTIFNRSIEHYKIEKFILMNDSLVALENGTDNANAIIVIAGTGSICYGRNQSGATVKVAGMDYLLADQGSGYAIGRMVLREAVKSFDGRSPKSILEKLVCDYFKIESIANLKQVVYHPPLSKIEVADLAPLCVQAYEANDVVAKEILNKTILEIITMIKTVHSGLALNSTQFDLVLSGSITSIPYIKDSLSTTISTDFPSCKIIFPAGDPVFGALKIALREAA